MDTFIKPKRTGRRLVMEINCRLAGGGGLIKKKNSSTHSTRWSHSKVRVKENRRAGDPLWVAYELTSRRGSSVKCTHFSLNTLRVGRWSFGSYLLTNRICALAGTHKYIAYSVYFLVLFLLQYTTTEDSAAPKKKKKERYKRKTIGYVRCAPAFSGFPWSSVPQMKPKAKRRKFNLLQWWVTLIGPTGNCNCVYFNISALINFRWQRTLTKFEQTKPNSG